MERDPLHEAETTLLYAQLEHRISEPQCLALVAKLFGMSPDKLHRLRTEGMTLEEQQAQEKAIEKSSIFGKNTNSN